jgi:hypothetical protein
MSGALSVGYWFTAAPGQAAAGLCYPRLCCWFTAAPGQAGSWSEVVLHSLGLQGVMHAGGLHVGLQALALQVGGAGNQGTAGGGRAGAEQQTGAALLGDCARSCATSSSKAHQPRRSTGLDCTCKPALLVGRCSSNEAAFHAACSNPAWRSAIRTSTPRPARSPVGAGDAADVAVGVNSDVGEAEEHVPLLALCRTENRMLEVI